MGIASAADSIVIAGGAIFVGFGNHHQPDGSDGLSSTIAKDSMAGKLLGTVAVRGHNGGLRYDPVRHLLWANENEDAHPRLVLIDPANLRIKATYTPPNPHGGGYDDDAFVGGRSFITASNPAKNPNTAPALIEAKLPASGTVLSIRPVLMGTASAVGARHGQPRQGRAVSACPSRRELVPVSTVPLEQRHGRSHRPLSACRGFCPPRG